MYADVVIPMFEYKQISRIYDDKQASTQFTVDTLHIVIWINWECVIE